MIDLVRVFTNEGNGGNPCPVILDAASMSSDEMQAIARNHGHECAFVLPSSSQEYDYSFRFWVPNQEMTMCGHAAIGALWVLTSRELVEMSEVRIDTGSGPVNYGDVVGRAVNYVFNRATVNGPAWEPAYTYPHPRHARRERHNV